MAGLFMDGLPRVPVVMFTFQQLLSVHLPQLDAHLQEQGVAGSMYSLEWLITGTLL